MPANATLQGSLQHIAERGFDLLQSSRLPVDSFDLGRTSNPCLQGFSARPAALADGSLDLMTWKCVIPGKAGVRGFNTMHSLAVVNS